MGVLLGGRFVALTADDLTRFQLFVRWSFCLSPQVLSARNISVADSYCNVFGFVLFFCARLFVRSLGSRVVSFVYSFLRLFVLSLFRPCLHWFCFFCARLVLRCIRVVRSVSLLFACNHSASPPGGNQVDGVLGTMNCKL